MAKKEVIVSGGTINSPQLLMLSGIGPAEDLQKLGIKVIQNLPVGGNLRDHVACTGIIILLNKTITNKSDKEKTADLNQYLEKYNGPLSAVGSLVVTVFSKTKYEENEQAPDAQFIFLGTNPPAAGLQPLAYYDQILIKTTLLTPKSKGYIKLNNTDPVWGKPSIYPGYFKGDFDVTRTLEIIRSSLQLFNTKTFRENGYKLDSVPKAPCDNMTFNSDKYWICMLRNYADPINHQVGTCKMGPREDSEAVVDPRLKVYGIKGLRVADASIMPLVPRGNTMAGTVMIGEKVSDMIKEDNLAQTKA